MASFQHASQWRSLPAASCLRVPSPQPLVGTCVLRICRLWWFVQVVKQIQHDSQPLSLCNGGCSMVKTVDDSICSFPSQRLAGIRQTTVPAEGLVRDMERLEAGQTGFTAVIRPG